MCRTSDTNCHPCESGDQKGLSGFTLIELLITILVLSVLLGAVSVVFNTGFRTIDTQGLRFRTKGEAGRALVTLSNELHQATAVTAATATSITFNLDTDGNGVDESIQYTWSGVSGQPFNRVGAVTTAMVNNVTSAAYSYFDANNNALGFPVTASSVRRIVIDLTATDHDEIFTLRSSVRPRDL